MSQSDDATVESLTTDRAFDLLGNATRRRAVATLRESDGAMALDDLAAETAARAADATPREVSEDRCKRTAVSLHHCHLPKLDDASVVEYDPVENRAEATPVAEELEPFFEIVETQFDDFQRD